MSPKIGPVNYSEDDSGSSFAMRRYGGATAGLIDDEVKRIAEECATSAGDLLERHRDKLDALVVALLVHDSLNEREILVVTRLGGAEATNGALPDGARGLVSSRPGP